MDRNPRNVIISTAIGKNYLDNWKLYSWNSWKLYIDKFEIGLLLVTENLVDEGSIWWKNAAWQKLLAPHYFKNEFPNIEKVALLDTDVIISPLSPNIFSLIDNETIGVVSQEKNLPYPLEDVKRRMAFLRHTFYDNRYPLDSILFASLDQISIMHKLDKLSDYFCSGFLLLGEKYFEKFKDWFYSVTTTESESSAAWEEPYLNSWVQQEANILWLDYKFQTLWNYEMAWKYPFLYEAKDLVADNAVALKCVEYTLWNCYFLHFAGAWHESRAWYNCRDLDNKRNLNLMYNFEAYKKKNLSGLPVGKILPNVEVNLIESME